MKFSILLSLVELLAICCFSSTDGVDVVSLSDLSEITIKEFFKKYSHNETYMRISDFKLFLDKMNGTLVQDHSGHDHSRVHSDHDHANRSTRSTDDHDHQNLTETYRRKFDHKCFEEKLLNLKKVSNDNPELIEKDKFAQLSSIFVSDLDQCINETVVWSRPKDDSFFSKINFQKENWLWAFLSAFIITVIGLLCYLVVPSLNAVYFNFLFQFLVAMAVGTLSGDALLHLIPHAFSGHDHSHESGSGDDHKSGVYKGLGAVVGIYVFFLIEKGMQIRRARKESDTGTKSTTRSS